MLPAEVHQQHQSARVPFELSGRRLDQVLSVLFPDYSRSRLQQWLLHGHVQVDGSVWRAKDKVKGGEQIALTAVVERQVADAPEDLPLEVVHADAHLIVVNKPAGLVVHPAAGNRAGTLLNALLHYAPELAQLPRAGIVHRLDKDTTGLLVVARTLEAQTKLTTQLQARSVSREYEALVLGVVVSGGTVDAPLGRHPVERKHMAVRAGGREAITHYRVVEHFRAHTHLRVQLETGRTHQIRVHLAHIHFPIIGDQTYGGRVRLPSRSSPEFIAALRQFPRQALHASRLSLDHPATGERLQWRAPLPHDMQDLLAAMRDDALASTEE